MDQQVCSFTTGGSMQLSPSFSSFLLFSLIFNFFANFNTFFWLSKVFKTRIQMLLILLMQCLFGVFKLNYFLSNTIFIHTIYRIHGYYQFFICTFRETYELNNIPIQALVTQLNFLVSPMKCQSQTIFISKSHYINTFIIRHTIVVFKALEKGDFSFSMHI